MNDIRQHKLLRELLRISSFKWSCACGMPRPSWWCFWRWPKFLRYVNATRKAIAHTLNYDQYPTNYIPCVDIIESEDGIITLEVHLWGKPR